MPTTKRFYLGILPGKKYWSVVDQATERALAITYNKTDGETICKALNDAPPVKISKKGCPLCGKETIAGCFRNNCPVE